MGLEPQLLLLYLNTQHSHQADCIAVRSAKLGIYQRKPEFGEDKRTSVFSLCSFSVPTQTFYRE